MVKVIIDSNISYDSNYRFLNLLEQLKIIVLKIGYLLTKLKLKIEIVQIVTNSIYKQQSQIQTKHQYIQPEKTNHLNKNQNANNKHSKQIDLWIIKTIKLKYCKWTTKPIHIDINTQNQNKQQPNQISTNSINDI